MQIATLGRTMRYHSDSGSYQALDHATSTTEAWVKADIRSVMN